MKVLVTGAGGLIGSYAVQALYRGEYEVTALYRKVPVMDETYRWKIKEADLTEDRSRSVLESTDVEVVVHCAAILPKQFEGEEGRLIAEINRQIDERVIKFCQDKGCGLIYTSGTSVYGSKGSPWNENSPVLPWGPYINAKVETEQRITELKTRFVILRISAPYAPEQRSRTVLKIFIERALSNLDLYYHGSGKRQQDFTAAEDVAQAILRAVFHNALSGIFNIASGNPISMRDLAELVTRCVPGTTSHVLPSGQPDPQEEYRAVFDISKAKNLLGWNPSTTLEDGIQRWVRYLEKNQ